jgi:hypothetical protein
MAYDTTVIEIFEGTRGDKDGQSVFLVTLAEAGDDAYGGLIIADRATYAEALRDAIEVSEEEEGGLPIVDLVMHF